MPTLTIPPPMYFPNLQAASSKNGILQKIFFPFLIYVQRTFLLYPLFFLEIRRKLIILGPLGILLRCGFHLSVWSSMLIQSIVIFFFLLLLIFHYDYLQSSIPMKISVRESIWPYIYMMIYMIYIRERTIYPLSHLFILFFFLVHANFN